MDVLLGLDEIMQVVLADRHLTNCHTHGFRLIDSPMRKFAIWAYGWERLHDGACGR